MINFYIIAALFSTCNVNLKQKAKKLDDKENKYGVKKKGFFQN